MQILKGERQLKAKVNNPLKFSFNINFFLIWQKYRNFFDIRQHYINTSDAMIKELLKAEAAQAAAATAASGFLFISSSAFTYICIYISSHRGKSQTS
jgi:hypothetical protein